MQASYGHGIIHYSIAYIILALAVYTSLISKNANNELHKIRKPWRMLAVILLSALLFRIYLAQSIEGYPGDIATFKSWAMAAANDLSGMYTSGIYLDYPPFYLYFLYLVGKLVSIKWFSTGFTLLLKLPSIIAELVLGVLLYNTSIKMQCRPHKALFISALFLFNPAVLLNTCLWGMMDSFFTMLVAIAVLLVLNGNIEASAIFFALSVLTKPQGIFFIPIFLFELIKLIKYKKYETAVISVVNGILITAAVVLPFSTGQQPLWILDLYVDSAALYPYASLNAYNFFSMLGANLANDSKTLFMFSHKTWGLIFDALVITFAAFAYFRLKHPATPVITALFLNTGAFVLSTRMHERYMYPAVFLSILMLTYWGGKKLFCYTLSITAVVTANMHHVLYLAVNESYPHINPQDKFLFVGSIFSTALLALLVKGIWEYMRSSGLLPAAAKPGRPSVLENTASSPLDTALPINTALSRNTAMPQAVVHRNMQEDKPRRKDIVIMALMTIIYSVTALLNLGSLKVPQTSWTPSKAGEQVTIDLGRETVLWRVCYYPGLDRNRPNTGIYSLQYQDPSGNFQPLADIEKKEGDLFKWKYIAVQDITARFIKIVAVKPGATINEMAFFEKGSTEPLTGIRIIDYDTAEYGTAGYGTAGQSIVYSSLDNTFGSPDNLFDETALASYVHTYRTGMIFDEIYHARTAYEHLNGMPVYEWTHPPLGKLLISLGILLFGMNPFGWRIIGTLFGIAMIPLMYMFGLKMFKGTFYAFCCAFLIMFDFMHFGLSRISTIDIYATFFIIIMYYFIYQYFIKPSTKSLFFCGLFFGIGAACKWITLYAAGGIALLIVFAQYRLYRQCAENPRQFKTSLFRTLRNCILFFIVIPAIIYCLSYLPYYFVPDVQKDIGLIWRYQSSVFKYHSQYVLNSTHPYSSWWHEWPFILKPLVTFVGENLGSGISSTMAILGNPAIWWAGIASVFAAIATAWKKKDIHMSVVFVAVAFQYLPWAFVPRITFIYHFFSTVPFVILCIAYCIKTATDSFPKAVYAAWGYLALVFALFIMFFPVLSGLEVSRDYVNNWLHWVDGWNF